MASQEAATATLNAGDQINGGAGTDTLKIYGTAATNFASAAVSGVEVIKNYTGAAITVSGNTDVKEVWAMEEGAVATSANISQKIGYSGVDGAVAAVATFTNATGSADAATLAFEDAGKTTAYTSITVAGIEQLTLEASGTNKLGNVIADAATDITITGSGSLQATLAPTTTVLKSVVATANTGGVDLSMTDAQFGTNEIKVSTGSGNDKIAFTDAFGAKATIDLGAGNNSLTIKQGAVATPLTTGSTFKAGAGTADTLVLDTTTTSITSTTGAMFTGFETIKLINASSYVSGYVSGITAYEMSTGANTLTNAANGVDVEISAIADEVQTITLADNSAATSSIDITLDSTTPTTTAAIKGAQTTINTNAHVLNIVSAGKVLSTATNHNEVSIAGQADSLAQITNISAKGDQALDITTGAATALTLVDGSEATGKLLITATGATKAMVIKGGSAVDTIVTNNVAGTKVYGNGGADAIDLTAGSIGEIVVYSAQGDSTATAFDSLTGFRTVNTDKIDLKAFGFTGTADDAVTTKTTGITVTATTVDVTAAAAANFFADATAVDRGVAVFADVTDSWVFVDANKDGDYSAAADLVIKIVGGADGASAAAVIGDFVFA